MDPHTVNISHEDYMRAMSEAQVKQDDVNSPPHYKTDSDIECIDAIKAALGDGFSYYLQGNCIKYLWRFRHKGKPKTDLMKTRWYLSRLIDEVEN